MFRKPTRAATAAAKLKGHEPPPADPLGSFQVPHATVDKLRAAARTEAARRLKVVPSKLLVNVAPGGSGRRGEQQLAVLVYAPAADEREVA